MDSPISPRTASLVGMVAALAPETRDRVELAGHECSECRKALGHAWNCCTAVLERFAMHCRDHPPCRKIVIGMAGLENVDWKMFDLVGLCPRGQKLFDRSKALGEARDAEYERTMGDRPGTKAPGRGPGSDGP